MELSSLSGAGVISALVGIIVVLVRIIEWVIKKFTKNDPVDLHPETDRKIRLIYESINLLTSRDIDIIKAHNAKMADVMSSISNSQEKLGEMVLKMAVLLDKIDKRAEIDAEVNRIYAGSQY